MGCGLTNTDDVELEAALQELALDLRSDAVEPNMALGVHRSCRHGRHFCVGRAIERTEIGLVSKRQLASARRERKKERRNI